MMHLSDHGSGEATSTDNVTESNANILTEDIKNIQLDEVIAREPPSAASKPPADAPPASLQGAELAAEIVRQVEFYFSDANLPTDDYMLKQIRCTPEGWVPLKAIGDFRKMKKLTRSLPVIAAAIQEGSSALEISPDGHSVRRLASLPEVDLDEVRRRTVMADNLPDNATIEQVIEMFSPAGEVVMARIRKPEAPEPLLTRGLKGDVAKTNRTYALIEFATPDQAHQAVKLLHEPDNWRTGLRVRRLLAGGVKHAQQGKKKKQSQQAEHAELDGQGAVDTTSGGEGCSVGVEKKEGEASPSGGPSEGGTPEPGTGHGKAKHPKLPWNTEKKRNKSEYAAWASAGAAQQAKQAAGGGKGATDDGGHGGSSAGGASSGTAGGVGRVRMPVAPDGTRGFAMGRGKALTPPPPGLVSPV